MKIFHLRHDSCWYTNVIISIFALLVGMRSDAAGVVEILDVTAQQQEIWDGPVKITVKVTGVLNDDIGLVDCAFTATNCSAGAVVPITRISRVGSDFVGDSIWELRYVWDAESDIGEGKIDDIALSVIAEIPENGVRLWENGPYWAECNVGANLPEECGYYFWWGDTIGYKRSDDKWCAVDGSTGSFSFTASNCVTYGKTKSQLQSLGYIDGSGIIKSPYDCATVHLGVPWRMPTSVELGSIIDKCDIAWTERNAMYGYRVCGKGSFASKEIFLPAAGNGYEVGYNAVPGDYGGYWSSLFISSEGASTIGFKSSEFTLRNVYSYVGRTVRPHAPCHARGHSSNINACLTSQSQNAIMRQPCSPICQN